MSAPEPLSPRTSTPAAWRTRLDRARATLRAQPPVMRWALGLVGALLALWLLLALLAPPVLRWQLQRAASAELGRPVDIGRVSFWPWSLTLVLHDVRVSGQPPDAPPAANGAPPPMLEVPRIEANTALSSLWRQVPVVSALRIESPHLRLVHRGDGHYDVDDVIARVGERIRAWRDQPAQVALYNIELDGGTIDLDDRARGRQHAVRDVHLALPFISTLPSEQRVTVKPRLAFVANGSAFDSVAHARPFADSRQTDAAFRITALDLAPYLDYQPAGLPLRLTSGRLDGEITLGFVQNPRPALRLGGTLNLDGVKAVDASGVDALAFDRLRAQLVDVRPLDRQLHLASLDLQGAQFGLRRAADGRLNWTGQPLPPPFDIKTIADKRDTAPTSGKKGSKSSVEPDGPQWVLRIDKLAVQGATLDWLDEAAPLAPEGPAASVRLNEVDLAATALSWPLALPAQFSGAAALVGADALTPPLPPHALAPLARKPVVAKAAGKGANAAAAAAPANPAASAAPAAKGAPAAAAQTATAAPGAPNPAPAAPATPADETHRVASFEFQGHASPQMAEVTLRLSALPLGLLAPYLADQMAPRLSGRVHGNLGLQWAAAAVRDLPDELRVASDELRITDAALIDPSPKADLAAALLGTRPPARADARRPAAPANAPVAPAQPAASATPAATGVPAPSLPPLRAIDPPATRDGWLMTARELLITQALLDVRTRAATLGRVVLTGPRLLAGRLDEERWMLHDWLRGAALAFIQPEPADAAKPKQRRRGPSMDFPWKVVLTELEVDDGALTWRDAAVSPPAAVDLTRVALKAGPVELAPGKTWPVNLSAQTQAPASAGGGAAGRVGWRGTLGLAPQLAQGALDLQRVPVAALQGYLADALPWQLTRGDATLRAQVAYADTPQGERLRLTGDATLHDWRAHVRPPAVAAAAPAPARAAPGKPDAKADGKAAPVARPASAPPPPGEELFSAQTLRLTGLEWTREPGRAAQIDVKESDVSDFSARVLVLADGRVLGPLTGLHAPAAAPERVAATVAAPANGASNAIEVVAKTQDAVRTSGPNDAKAGAVPAAWRLGPTRLSNGRVDWIDRSVEPAVQLQFGELAGQLGPLISAPPGGTAALAELTLAGRVRGATDAPRPSLSAAPPATVPAQPGVPTPAAEAPAVPTSSSGTAQLTGRINPFADPPALDLRADLRDVDFALLSPYVQRLSGHGVQAGRLVAHISYVTQPDGRLAAQHRFELAQPVFSDAIAGAGTQRPVREAAAQLADAAGLVRFEVPVAGSLRDAAFAPGAALRQALGALIEQAAAGRVARLAPQALGAGASAPPAAAPGGAPPATGASVPAGAAPPVQLPAAPSGPVQPVAPVTPASRPQLLLRPAG